MRNRKWAEVSAWVLLFVFGSLMGNQANGDIQEGLVAYFKFEEGKGKELSDSSGLGNDAEIKGDVDWVEEPLTSPEGWLWFLEAANQMGINNDKLKTTNNDPKAKLPNRAEKSK